MLKTATVSGREAAHVVLQYTLLTTPVCYSVAMSQRIAATVVMRKECEFTLGS